MKLCSIPDCPRRHYAKGWCNLHWQRWKSTGDPLGMHRVPGAVIAYFRDHVMDASDGCRIWPYYTDKDGYGKLTIGNQPPRGVHSLTCEAWYGPKPYARAEVAHSCNNRACWAGEHLRWTTRRQNAGDMTEHGTVRRGSIHHLTHLSEADVLAIRSRRATGERVKDLATEYSITPQTVWRIVKRKNWTHL